MLRAVSGELSCGHACVVDKDVKAAKFAAEKVVGGEVVGGVVDVESKQLSVNALFKKLFEGCFALSAIS